MIGCVTPRRINFLAKKTLFRFPLGPIIRTLDSIPIERDGIGIGGIKETLRRLKRDEAVLIFPEGQRSWDGELLPLMGGFTALVKRVPMTLVPVGIEGTHHVWPRGTTLPKPGNIQVVVGEPIEYDELKDLSDEELQELVAERIRVCFDEARRHYRHVRSRSPSS